MVRAIRAIYEDGHLRLLDPFDLTEGQQVNIAIIPDREAVRAALGDLLIQVIDPTNDNTDEVALAREIEEAFRGLPPLSDAIIQERREGP